MRRFSFLILFLLGNYFSSAGQDLTNIKPGSSYSDFSKDGAWCWFSDPRAIYTHGKNPGILSGWVKTDGTIETGFMNTTSFEIGHQILYPQFEEDDHNHPSFVETPNSKLAFYTRHSHEAPVFFNRSIQESNFFQEPDSIDVISPTEFSKFPRKTTTYANPIYLKNEDRLFCFGRWTGFKPNIIWSDDQGDTFTKARVLITNYPFDSNNRPYVKYYSNGDSRIHIVFTDGHPRNEASNSVYYACYEDGWFFRANGTKITSLDKIPFEPSDATVVYQADSKKGRAWIYDVSADENDNPVILYARYPNEQTHLYHYSRLTQNGWKDFEICNAGKWFPHTLDGQIEPEPHYSGGMTIHPRESNVVYVSQEIDGVFEIIKYKLENNLWKSTPITANSKRDNVRPFFPRNMKADDVPVLLWMENEVYVHYTAYKSNIKYMIDR